MSGQGNEKKWVMKSWTIKKVFMTVIGVLVLAAFSLSAISNAKKQQPNNSSDNGKVDGYVYHDSKTAYFLKFTNSNGDLSGSIYERFEDSNNQFKTYDTPLSGKIDGNSISITLKASGNTYTGNFSNGEIDLAVPQKDGTVSNCKFKPGTLTDFNKYVADIQSGASSDQQAAQQAQQKADLNKQLSDLESKINKEMQTIQETDAQTLQSDVQSTGTDINAEKKDMDVLKQDYQTAMSSGATMDANQVRSDANQIQSDDNQIQSDYGTDIGGFKHDVQALQNDLTVFQSDVQNMNSLASQLGQTLPEYLPKKSDIDSIVNKANSIIKSTTDAMNGYISTSKQMLNSANGLADKAQKHAGN